MKESAGVLSTLIRRWISMQDSTLTYMDVIVEDALRSQRYLQGDKSCLGLIPLARQEKYDLLDALALCVLKNYEEKMTGLRSSLLVFCEITNEAMRLKKSIDITTVHWVAEMIDDVASMFSSECANKIYLLSVMNADLSESKLRSVQEKWEQQIHLIGLGRIKTKVESWLV